MCVEVSFFFFYFRAFSSSSPLCLSGLRWSRRFSPLMTAGSRQHVAVIKSKEIGKRGREEKKKCLSGDFAKKKKKKKKKTPGEWKEKGRQKKRGWKRIGKSRPPWRNVFVLRPENLHAITHTAHTHTRAHVTVLTCVDRRAQTASLLTCTDGESKLTHTNTHRGRTLNTCTHTGKKKKRIGKRKPLKSIGGRYNCYYLYYW